MSNPNDRVIPLTPLGPLWSQREYVACVGMGIQFSAHRYGDSRQVFHYGFPGDIGCTSVIVGVNGVERYIDHDFTIGHDWIRRASLAVGDAK